MMVSPAHESLFIHSSKFAKNNTLNIQQMFSQFPIVSRGEVFYLVVAFAFHTLFIRMPLCCDGEASMFCVHGKLKTRGNSSIFLVSRMRSTNTFSDITTNKTISLSKWKNAIEHECIKKNFSSITRPDLFGIHERRLSHCLFV